MLVWKYQLDVKMEFLPWAHNVHGMICIIEIQLGEKVTSTNCYVFCQCFHIPSIDCTSHFLRNSNRNDLSEIYFNFITQIITELAIALKLPVHIWSTSLPNPFLSVLATRWWKVGLQMYGFRSAQKLHSALRCSSLISSYFWPYKQHLQYNIDKKLPQCITKSLRLWASFCNRTLLQNTSKYVFYAWGCTTKCEQAS